MLVFACCVGALMMGAVGMGGVVILPALLVAGIDVGPAIVSIYVAVIEAAALADDWILVDRSREDHSPTAELLLELALEKTNARPSILLCLF